MSNKNSKATILAGIFCAITILSCFSTTPSETDLSIYEMLFYSIPLFSFWKLLFTMLLDDDDENDENDYEEDND